MGTEVLRPHDFLVEGIRDSPAVFNHHRRKNFNMNGSGNGNHNPRTGTRKPAVRPNQKRRYENGNRSEPAISHRSASSDDLRKNQSNRKSPVARPVTILRRGQSLDKLMVGDLRHNRAAKCDGDQTQFGETKPISLSPGGFSGHRVDVYAGSTVTMSPSPRSLPLPSFFSKKPVSRISDDSATRDLRRLLRLE